MSARRLKVCRFFGFDIYADGSWVILAVLIAWTFAAQVFPAKMPGLDPQTYQYMGIAGLFGVIISILIHEIGHAVIAEYYKMPITGITLYIFGGVAEMQGDPSHPKGEFLMAIAGPIMSLFMAVVFWSSGILYEDYTGQVTPASKVLAVLATMNIYIAVLNMVPAFPLDGGRAFRAILWHIKGNLVSATRLASELGSAFYYGLLAYACYCVIYEQYVTGIWWGLIGFFLHASGRYATRQTESRSLLTGQKVCEFMRTNLVSVSPDLSIADLVDNYIYKHYHKSFPVLEGGRLVGIVSLQSVMTLDRQKWPWLHVSTVMERISDDNTISPQADAAEALDRMNRSGKGRLLVIDEGKLVGVLSMRDMADYLSITMKLDKTRALRKGKKPQ